ncbi:hypothetical protein Tco_1300664 [Tanacetum coccineum]
MDNTGIFGNAYNDVEEEVDKNNVDTSYTASDAPFTKFLKDHPQDQVYVDPHHRISSLGHAKKALCDKFDGLMQNSFRKAIRNTEISQSSGTINLVADETVYKEWEDRMEKAFTTASSLDAER